MSGRVHVKEAETLNPIWYIEVENLDGGSSFM
jgi:hypothetical protein